MVCNAFVRSISSPQGQTTLCLVWPELGSQLKRDHTFIFSLLSHLKLCLIMTVSDLKFHIEFKYLELKYLEFKYLEFKCVERRIAHWGHRITVRCEWRVEEERERKFRKQDCAVEVEQLIEQMRLRFDEMCGYIHLETRSNLDGKF